MGGRGISCAGRERQIKRRIFIELTSIGSCLSVVDLSFQAKRDERNTDQVYRAIERAVRPGTRVNNKLHKTDISPCLNCLKRLEERKFC